MTSLGLNGYETNEGKARVSLVDEGELGGEGVVDTMKSGTSNDRRDMARLGKEQELNVRNPSNPLPPGMWLIIPSATSASSPSLALLAS